MLSNGVYKQKKIPGTNLKLTTKELNSKPENLALAARSCDGTYYIVSSEIKKVFKLKKKIIRKGAISEIVSEFNPDESIHGQRFVIFKTNKKQAVLLGDVATAFRQFANR